MANTATLETMEYSKAKIDVKGNILDVEVLNSVVHQNDLEDIRDVIESIDGDFYALLYDFSQVSRITSDVRNKAWKTNKSCLGKAIVVNSFLKEMLIKSYLLMTSSEYPIRIFFDKKEAKEWLNDVCNQTREHGNMRNVISML